MRIFLLKLIRIFLISIGPMTSPSVENEKYPLWKLLIKKETLLLL